MADNEHDDIYFSASNSRTGDSPGPAGVNDPQGIPADVVRPVQHAEDNNVCFVFFSAESDRSEHGSRVYVDC